MDRRRALIESLLDKQGISPIVRRIPKLPRTGDNTFPAAHAQQRIWFLQQVDPQSSAYNIPMAFRISGDIDADCLKECLSYLSMRHEALRILFFLQDGKLCQSVGETVKR